MDRFRPVGSFPLRVRDDGGEKDRDQEEDLEEVRGVVEDLRPSLLDHFGLGVALRSHFDEICKREGIECMASLPEEAVDLDPALQLTLFRVAQEVLANIVKRGGAKNLEVVVEPHEQVGRRGYLLTIGDDGNPPSEGAASTARE